MTSLAALTRITCATCQCDTLHRGQACVHCGTLYAQPLAREVLLDAMGKCVMAEVALRLPKLQRVPASERPCSICKAAARESGPYCKPCKQAYNGAYERRRTRRVPA